MHIGYVCKYVMTCVYLCSVCMYFMYAMTFLNVCMLGANCVYVMSVRMQESMYVMRVLMLCLLCMIYIYIYEFMCCMWFCLLCYVKSVYHAMYVYAECFLFENVRSKGYVCVLCMYVMYLMCVLLMYAMCICKVCMYVMCVCVCMYV